MFTQKLRSIITKRPSSQLRLLLAFLLCVGWSLAVAPQVQAVVQPEVTQVRYKELRDFCVQSAPKAVDKACTESNLEQTWNSATYHCQDKTTDGNKKTTCIQNAAEALISKTLSKKPKNVTDFNKDLGVVLDADNKAHNGSKTVPSPDSVGAAGSETPTTYCGAADCPDPVPDPALCAAKPSAAGCDANANASCTKNSCDLVEKYVNPAIDVLSVIFGLIAAISLILGGIQYTASSGDPQKASLAKKRIAMTVIAFMAYAFLYGFIQFLIPGGAFK